MKTEHRSLFRKIGPFVVTALFMLMIPRCILGLTGDGTAKATAEGPGGYADTLFDQLNQKNGLLDTTVQAITQDADGFMWIGTQGGVARWDGYHFRFYSMEPGVAGTLPSNNVMTLYTDPQKRLWVGTNRGLARFDPASDHFQTFTPAGSGGTYPSIYSMTTDGAHGLWLATRKGLDHFDPDTGKFQREPMQGIEGAANTQAVVRDLDGHVWAGSTKGLFYSDATGHNFKAVTIATGKTVKVWSLLRDHEGRLWIGATAGAFVLEPGQTLPRQVHETGYRDPAAGTNTPDATSPLDTQGVDAMIEAEPGIVWLATYGEGIVEVDTKTWLTRRIVHQPSTPTSLSHDLVDALYRDRAGTVWAGSMNGLSRKNPTGKGFLTFFGGTSDAAHPITDSDITAVMPTSDGRLWLGLADKGIEVFDQSGNKVSDSISANPSKMPLKMQLVSGFAQAPDGSMYFGSQQGLFHADRDGRHIQPITFTQGNLAIKPLFYEAGKLWIGSSEGLWILPLPAAGNSKPVLQTKPLLTGSVTTMARGHGNDLWVGTGNTLSRVDLVTEAVEKTDIDPNKPGSLPTAITSLMVDREGRLWVSTDGTGLYQLQGRNNQGQWLFRKITTADAGQTFEMPNGRIWFAGDHGIEVLDPRTSAITTFTQPDGVAIETYWLNAGAVTPDGRLLLGGVGGLTIVQPQLTHRWEFAAPVVVTEFSTGEKVDPRAQYLANSGSGGVQVQPYANSFAVEFAALDFSNSEQNKYAYRMVGFDHDWIATDSSRRTARYTNLSPGRYTFQIRGSNREGVWGATRSVAIRILPAWYQTIWAKLAAAVIGVALVFWLFQIYTAILRARQRHLERQVALRTMELEELTVKLQLSQHELERIAYSDSLTGLSNRRMFADCFQRMLEQEQQQQTASFTLLLIDLDNFKNINDSYGHDIGDALLREVANRFNQSVNDCDCLARLGGDEFAFLLADTADDVTLEKFCRDILHMLDEPFVLNGISLRASVSMGAAVYPQDGTGQESLFKSADLALYEVKRQGRNGWRRRTDQAPASDASPNVPHLQQPSRR